MINFQNCLLPPGGKAIVLSIKPKYADLILTGSKTVEFRRSWATEQVEVIVIYASAPVCRLVGSVQVKDVKKLASSTLLSYCSRHGGGLTQKELLAYFEGKEKGYAVLLENVIRFQNTLDPHAVIENFSAPQSFRYLTAPEMRKIEQKTMNKKGK